MGKFGERLLQQTGNVLANTTGGGIAGMGMSWLDEALFGNKRRKQQIEQQKKLTEIQTEANKELADYGMGISKQMFDYTGYENQRKQMEAAGLNPALMYGHAGSGGTTTSSSAGTASGSQASDEMSRKQSSMQSIGMGLQMQRQMAEIRLLNANAKKAEAGANLESEQTITEQQKRDILIENMKQEGISNWLHNVETEYKHGTNQPNEITMFRNVTYNTSTSLQSMSMYSKEIAAAILKTESEAGNQNAQEVLNNERAKVVYGELLVAMQKADAETTKAKAIELASMWETGEMTNWKTWAELAAKGINSLSNAVGAISPKGIIKHAVK